MIQGIKNWERDDFMGKTILFSPIGGTDPIANSNLRDGSMLHICRCYMPDKVYLYMSNEILSFQEQDQRYTYCLDMLGDKLQHKFEYQIIARRNMRNVQEFDPFYREFRKIIIDIQKNMTEEDTLLLNISSGTPAMKSALLVLKTLGEFSCKAIQVTTPDASMNNHDGYKEHKKHDVKTLWELDEDNEEGFENRCSVVKCPTLMQIQQENYVRKLLDEYDYAAAYEIAKMLPEEITANYMGLLRMAERRILLDFSGVDKILLSDKRFVLPVKDSDVRKYFEYALNLQVKLNRREYADFIRAVTPLLFDLYEKILYRHANIELKNYCTQRNNKSWIWSEERLKGTKLLDCLQSRLRNFHYGDVNSYHMTELIQESDAAVEVKELVASLRKVEKELRNIAAHQIVSITEDTIVKQTEMTGNQIMNSIKKAFTYAGVNIKKEDWNSYDDMNTIIKKEMQKETVEG